jgi:hypothetical protein
LRSEIPYRVRSRAKSTGCQISRAVKRSLSVGEEDLARERSLALSRRSSASLNDDFFDIGQFQQLATNCVEAAATKSTWGKGHQCALL